MSFLKDKKKLNKFFAILLKLFIAFIKKLPHGFVSKLGSFLGVVLWFFSYERVSRLETRCVSALGLGVTLSRKVIKDSYANMGRIVCEFFCLKSREEASKLMSLVGEDNLREALNKGCGVILMTAHLANWEIAAAVGCYHGYPLHVIYSPQRNTAGVEDVLREQREKISGIGFIPSEGTGIKEAFRVLKRGEILCILQDLDARADGVESEFLGLPAKSHIGLVKLSKRFNCPIIPGRAVRDKKGESFFIFYPQLSLDEDVDKSLRICNNILESWVMEHPDQWMWILDRWKSMNDVIRNRPWEQ